MPDFQVVANFQPAGDQPKAIAQLVDGVRRGLRHQVLLGITGSGKSLPPEERVLVGIEQNGRIQSALLPIGELVDNALSAAAPLCTTDDNEMVLSDQLPCRYYAFAFDPVTKRSEWRPITAFIRHPTPETLYRLRTACGRTVTVTGDHNVWVGRDGRLQLLRTTELQIGDCVPLPMSLPVPPRPLKTVPVASALRGQKVFAQVPAAVTELALPREKRWHVIRQGEGIALDMPPQSVADWALLKGKRYPRPATLRLTDEWLTLLGAYLAEGHAADRFVRLSAREPSWRQRVKDALTRLGFRYGVRADGELQVSSSLLTRCLATWCGRTAQEKRLPSFWLQLSNHQLSTLLAAYFAGGGWVEAEGVGCLTASQRLADDLLWALMRLGIWARVRCRRIRQRNGTRTSCWAVTITGRENLKRFARWVGFACATKQQRWRALLKRNRRRAANTNVDLIPVSGESLKRLRSLLHWSQADLAQAMGIGQASVSMMESNQRQPSRQAC
ncbi:MAG: helix-turn-helix domain-containing protein, partial [Abditibacteriales bacterium]|nr:helix-turn-helix domain-containing protein [Abditibacteriales bacterium]